MCFNPLGPDLYFFPPPPLDDADNGMHKDSQTVHFPASLTLEFNRYCPPFDPFLSDVSAARSFFFNDFFRGERLGIAGAEQIPYRGVVVMIHFFLVRSHPTAGKLPSSVRIPSLFLQELTDCSFSVISFYTICWSVKQAASG